MIDPALPISVIHDRYSGAPCFANQDAKIATWLGLRTVGYLVGLSPLRPLTSDRPQSLRDEVAAVQRVDFAAQAGVAAIGSYRDIEVVDLARGTPISTRYTTEGGLLASISPNGRVYITLHNGEYRFYDSEDGTLLAKPDWGWYGGSCGFHWLGRETILIAAPYDAVRGPALYDFRTGATEPLNGELGQVCSVVPVPGVRSTFVAFADTGITRFRLVRGTGGRPRVERTQQRRIKLNLIAGSGGLVAGGHEYVNTSNGDLVITDLDSLRTQSIAFGRFTLQRALPTSDPDKVLIAGYVPGIGPSNWTFYEYALGEQTLSRIDSSTLPSTQLVYDPVQAALFAQKGDALTRVDALQAGEPTSMAAFSRQTTQAVTLPVPPIIRAMPGGAAAITTEGGRVMRVFARPGPVAPVHPMSRFVQGADIAGITALATPGHPWTRYVGTIPGTEVKVYRPTAGAPPNAVGPLIVRVTVLARTRPLVLVLASDVGAVWRFDIKPHAHLAAILMTGPNGGSAQNQGAVPAFVIGRAYGCAVGSPSYVSLQNEVYASTGQRMGRFQCVQGVSRFTVH
ncbi:MAG: hypothetical protein ACREPL_13930 [Rhodanobacteraceae bacterium]